jgi:hypothetical protein
VQARCNGSVQVALNISQSHESEQNTSIDEHEHEVFVIFVTYAVVDPLAVVIHLQDAFVALVAMMGPWGFIFPNLDNFNYSGWVIKKKFVLAFLAEPDLFLSQITV